MPPSAAPLADAFAHPRVGPGPPSVLDGGRERGRDGVVRRGPLDLPILVNAEAGRVRRFGLKSTLWRISRRTGVDARDLIVTTGASLAVDLAALAALRPRGVAVLGGDGTGRTAIERLTPHAIPVAPLPGGTMNRLTHRVFGHVRLDACLDLLAVSGPRSLSGGRIGSQRFLVAAGFGPWMGLNALREAARRHDWGGVADAWRRARGDLFSRDLSIRGLAGGADAVLVGVGPLDAAFGFGRRDEQAARTGLEIAALAPAGLVSMAALGAQAIAGGWRARADVTAALGTAFTIDAARTPVGALVDGEPMRFDAPIEIGFDPDAGLVFAPPLRPRRDAAPKGGGGR